MRNSLLALPLSRHTDRLDGREKDCRSSVYFSMDSSVYMTAFLGAFYKHRSPANRSPTSSSATWVRMKVTMRFEPVYFRVTVETHSCSRA